MLRTRFSRLPRLLVLGSVALLASPGAALPAEPAVATFAGGCFWCVEADFDKIDGVLSTTSGYTGGHTPDPSYQDVSAGGTGHTEAVRIEYDPQRVSYAALLEVFWVNHDPTTKRRQFCDQGRQYRPGIFYHDTRQQALAEASKRRVARDNEFPIVTEITAAGPFYPAEAYHQDYYRKNPLRYKLYRYGCGRDARLDELWGSVDAR